MKRFSLAAVGSAALAALILPGNAPGIGVSVVSVGVAAAVAAAAGADRDAVLFGSLSVGLASMAAVRAAGWVVALDLMAALGLAAVAATGVERWRDLAQAPLRVLAGVLRAPGLVLGSLLPRRRPGWLTAPVLRGTLAGLLLIAVFGSLFFSADRAFARLTERFLLPEWDIELLPMRLVAFCVTGLLAGALAAARPALATEPSPWTSDKPPAWEPRLASRIEWGIALGLLDLLFALFVVVQLAFLFGGHALVQRTVGLTYAEYAREGFFQLLAAAGLVLAVVGGAFRWAGLEGDRDRRLLRTLLGALCLLTLVVLASVLRRLGLYEETFGLTRARLVAHAAALWLGVILLLVTAAGLRGRAPSLPRAVLALSASGLLAFSLADPDGVVASRNVARYEATGKLDRPYLASLSLDAVPAVETLPRKARAPLLAEFRDRLVPEDAWPAWNLGRERARDLLEMSPRSRGA